METCGSTCAPPTRATGERRGLLGGREGALAPEACCLLALDGWRGWVIRLGWLGSEARLPWTPIWLSRRDAWAQAR